jgi:hypothetical protein
MKNLISKVLSTLGLLTLIVVGIGIAFKGYLVTAVAQRSNPALDIAAATNKIATDPFAKGPSVGNVIVIIFAVIGILAVAAVIGYIVYLMRARKHYQKQAIRQRSPRSISPRPQIANTGNGMRDALNALVQLEMTRYLRDTQGRQNRGELTLPPPERPTVIHLGHNDPVDDLLRNM